MTAEILNERAIEVYVGGWRLIPSRGGVFEISVNGEVIFSKKASARFPETDEIRSAIRQKLKELRPFSGHPPNDVEVDGE